MKVATRFAACAAAVLMAGCSALQVDRNVEEAAQLVGEATGGAAPRLMRDAETRDKARAEVDAMLARPLAMDDAVRIAVVQGAALQAALFDGAARSAAATQSTRLPNPIFTFERLVGEHDGRETDLVRKLAFSVFDLLLLPQRIQAADAQQQQLRLLAAGEIVRAAAEARQAWVRAVAAQEAAVYAGQVKDAADAGAELARRMQGVGNFSKLQRAREQAFYAEATAQLGRARQAATAAREALVRTLGLDEAQARRLTLPGRLPDLPPTAQDEGALARTAIEQRLDVRMARAELDYVARQQGLTRITSFINGLEVAAVHESEAREAPHKGFEIELPLPIFDFGDARRAQAEATYMAALNRTALVGAHATSQLREAYGAYRTAYDLARHYRDEIVPLRKSIAEEMLLKYNGMLIGVFELLADSRDQIGAVTQAIEAQRDFWLADAALKASLVGRPLGGASMELRAPAAASATAGH